MSDVGADETLQVNILTEFRKIFNSVVDQRIGYEIIRIGTFC